MTSRGVRVSPWRQPERTTTRKTAGTRRRTESTGQGRAVYGLLHRAINHPMLPAQPLRLVENRSPERMSRGELYEYYKRIGMLEVYFALFPGG
jgi:hypothetical protein